MPHSSFVLPRNCLILKTEHDSRTSLSPPSSAPITLIFGSLSCCSAASTAIDCDLGTPLDGAASLR